MKVPYHFTTYSFDAANALLFICDDVFDISHYYGIITKEC